MPPKPKPSSALGPLHFEDLEPHRFEDLVRQLAYEFRDWSDIQAIGRTGSDGGMDARAYETLAMPSTEGENDDLDSSSLEHSRLWVIQCKRQTAFGPKQATSAVEDISVEAPDSPFGLILAAPANVSLGARRAFSEACRRRGFQEFYLWGKGELEDQLFLPKNDHLLFAYFGISIQVRRRNIRTEQKSLITFKKQLVRVLGDVSAEHYEDVLIRDPQDQGYPLIDDRKRFLNERPWWIYRFVEHWPLNHLSFEVRRLPAYINPETNEWDLIDYDMLAGHQHELWGLEADRTNGEWSREWQAITLERERFMKFHDELPEENRGYISIQGIIPYDRIIAIDDLGDRVNKAPHLIVVRNQSGSFFDSHPFIPKIERLGNRFGQSLIAYSEKRISHFPKRFPKVTVEEMERSLKEKLQRLQQKPNDGNELLT